MLQPSRYGYPKNPLSHKSRIRCQGNTGTADRQGAILNRRRCCSASRTDANHSHRVKAHRHCAPPLELPPNDMPVAFVSFLLHHPPILSPPSFVTSTTSLDFVSRSCRGLDLRLVPFLLFSPSPLLLAKLGAIMALNVFRVAGKWQLFANAELKLFSGRS